MGDYLPVIGLEIHIQAKTKSKMFCPCNANYFGARPNTFVCPVCLGLPGALPVPNKEAITKCLKLALALDCSINLKSKFDRKNYFYPDLPKGYQISQYDLPIGYAGYVPIDINGDEHRIRITRVHMEEDTGKSLHEQEQTLLDFNKSGVPLIEVVTEPDFTDVKEVNLFAKRLRQIVRYLDISDADMEKGQMRFELNMSLKKPGDKGLPPYKIEVKNIGSISVLEKVIATEMVRQGKILDEGKIPQQETRGLVDMSGKTKSQRVKEEAHDYRYFPEPDIPPLVFTQEQIAKIKQEQVELPHQKKARYLKEFKLEPDTAETIVSSKVKAAWFEEAVTGVTDTKVVGQLAKWFVGDLMALLKADRKKLKELAFQPRDLANLMQMLVAGKLTGTMAKQVLQEMYQTGAAPEVIVAEKGFIIVNNEDELNTIIAKVITDNPKVVADVARNPNAMKFLLGQVMRATRGKAVAQTVEKLLKQKLG